jgi:hypothetical protein
MQIRKTRSLLLCVSLLAAGVAWLADAAVGASNSQSMVLKGQVLSATNSEVLKGTPVTLISWPTGGRVATTVTGVDGSFSFNVPRAGTYTVMAQPADGRFAHKSSGLIRLDAAGQNSAQVHLRLAPVANAKDVASQSSAVEAARLKGNVVTDTAGQNPGLDGSNSGIRIVSRPPGGAPTGGISGNRGHSGGDDKD